MPGSAFPSKYGNDIRLFLVLIPFINVFTYYLTYPQIRFDWWTLVTFLVDTFEGYAAWMAVRFLIIKMDDELTYESGQLRRITVQLLITTVTGLLIIIALTEIVNALATPTPVPTSFYTVDIFIICIWFFVVNGIYIGLYYYRAWQLAEESRREENRIKTSGFLVRSGKQELLLAFEDIGGFFVDGDYAVVCTCAGKKYLLDQSLDNVEKTLPVVDFFRVNRQFIIHRQLISGYGRGENGKLSVFIKGPDPLPSQVIVSRTKAPQFKTWFLPH